MWFEDFWIHVSRQSFSLKLLALFVVLAFSRPIVRVIVQRAVQFAFQASEPQRAEKIRRKTKTLTSLLVNTTTVVLWLIVGMIILDLIGIDIRPILAGASVLGFAIGFGSQSLVKDLVAGMFIIIEDQFSVGDRVKIGTISGKVVRLTARSTVLRDDDGALVFLENGTVGSVVNYSRTVKAVSKKTAA